MGTLGDILSMATTFVAFAVLASGVMKLFQIATDMGEMKELLKDIRRNTDPTMQPAQPGARRELPASQPPPVPTPEELVRAVHAQRFSDDEFPV